MNDAESKHPLILASQSPRRRQLMTDAGYQFEVVPARDGAEDAVWGNEDPAELVARLAYQKAADVALRVERGILIGCDTVAECDGHILGKPTARDDARRMLQMLSGSDHRVLTGLCVWQHPERQPTTVVEVTTLRMDRLLDEQINAYLDTDAWQGKAGAFGYQDRLGWIHITEGSESNVVGLPIQRLQTMLDELGFFG